MMKTTPHTRRPRGYVSFLLVLTTGATLTLLSLYAYRRALAAHSVQSQIQLRIDYSEKEEAILRSIVAITPNRAIRAMQSGSNANQSVNNPLRWQNIFEEALALSNAGKSISSELVDELGIPDLLLANTGDSTLNDPRTIFKAIAPETGYVSAGINRSLGPEYPPPLSTNNPNTTSRDPLFPIIAANKEYGSLAQDGVGLPVTEHDYNKFNLIRYPEINFGYAQPGEDFVAKRNWWAFSLDVGGNDADRTFLARARRDYVLSIYEIPSQLAISASAFMSLGKFASGEAWQNVTIDGGIFAGKAEVEGDTAINALSSRRGMTLSSGTTIGGQSFDSSPFTPGLREAHQMTEGTFFPVSLASESGRAAFVPINRGADFFDRFSHQPENNVLSTTTWNDYSVGALQCAMQIDITQVQSGTDPTPTMLRFSYLLSDKTRANMDVPLTSAVVSTLPPGYVKVCNENQSYTFPEAVDVAYGVSGGFTFRAGVSGTIRFDDATFGDPKQGTFKAGYWRPRFPTGVRSLPNGNLALTVFPERIPKLLAAIGGAAGPAINHSLVVNVDYTINGLNNPDKKPWIPCTDNDYGVVLGECADLTPFTKGFSLVTNLRLYIGDDFNTVATTPPSGYTPAGDFFPPCSLFAPEKRYGVEVDAFAVTLGGQIGSLASDTVANPIRPLDSTAMSGAAIASDKITVNLSPIRHPAELPPITMMNWLILLEERRQ